MTAPRYGAYTASGVSWLDEVPSHWRIRPLKHLAPFISRGNSPSYAETDEGIKIINQACIYWDGLWLENIKFQEHADVAGWKGLLHYGDLLMNSTGTGTLGRTALFEEPGHHVADSHVTIIRVDPDRMHASFLRYLLSTTLYQGYIYADLVSGATNQIELSQDKLRRAPVICPPPAEQFAIVALLDRETARIDTLIAKKRRLIELLREKRQAVISDAVTKGLDPNAPMQDSGMESPVAFAQIVNERQTHLQHRDSKRIGLSDAYRARRRP
jgi:type I restriction enzyme, S subunit